jgi:acyl-CoA synthetase (AMP-forming)/AMP-acid ligase II/3-oxoacyl-(acyl-carrier-protein) synthase/acyl carrier protein
MIPRTLVDLLTIAAAAPRPAGVRCADPAGEATRWTYAELLARAEAGLGALRRRGVTPGVPVVLLLHRPVEFLPAFWSAQLAGAVPVPLAPPADPEAAQRLLGVWEALGRPLVIAPDDLAAGVATPLGEDRVLPVGTLAEGPRDAGPHLAAPDDLALLQYSSGSTRDPRGVRLSHANLLANVRQMTTRASLGEGDVELGWMPLYHDMGLIGNHLSPLSVNAEQIKMTPEHFLRQPGAWLDLATAHRATLLTATNTALRLLLRRVPADVAARYDLSAVRSLLVGAEPVSGAVLRQVAARLGPAGLAPGALRVCYGLAEASVGVCFAAPGEGFRVQRVRRELLAREGRAEPAAPGDPAAQELVEVGPPLPDVEVRIAGEDGEARPDRRVGAILVQGPNVTAGYHGLPEATAAARRGPWWDTGDLGFRVDGRVVICGRTKDLIIVDGRNHHAADLEVAAQEEPGIRSAVAGATRSPDGTRELALLFLAPEAETWTDAVDALEGARRRVQRLLGAPVDVVVPVRHRDLPRTSSGKTRRFRMVERLLTGDLAEAARDYAAALAARAAEVRAPADVSTDAVRRLWADVLGRSAAEIGPDDRFTDLGGTSAAAQEVLARLEDATGRTLGADLLRRCATPAELARYLAATAAVPAPVRPAPGAGAPDAPVAVIGLACRLPGASSPAELRERLRAGADAVGPIPADRFPSGTLAGSVCPAGAFLDDPYAFDPARFDLGDDEAALLDPQQRLALDLALECLEGAGYGAARRAGLRVGVFLGASHLPHQDVLGLADPLAFERLRRTAAFAALPAEHRHALAEAMERVAPRQIPPATLVGNLLNLIAARVAHQLDLTGPALVVDTACSSSLVAVHLARESLGRGECDLALAGGVSLTLSPTLYRLFSAAGALSPTGRSRPFAAGGDGFVPGEGGGLVLLAREADARRAGDPVVGRIRGSAVGNDGRSLGPMAPNPAGQLAVIREALARAGVDPATVTVVEAHGTGTAISDPVELRTLAAGFGADRPRPLSIGSIKSSVGHLLAAAGIAGLLKVLLGLRHRELYPSLHAEPAHPRLADLPGLRVQAALAPWDAPAPRRAGVSAFGFGGTNAHVIVEEAPAPPDAPAPDRAVALTLSAPTAAQLPDLAADLAGRAGDLDPDRAGLARTLHDRTALATRAARVLAPAEPLGPVLRGLADGSDPAWRRHDAGPGARPALRVAFLFPGQGAQRPHPARGLHDAWPDLRARRATPRRPRRRCRPRSSTSARGRRWRPARAAVRARCSCGPGARRSWTPCGPRPGRS